MRYRPFGLSGIAISAISVALDGLADRRNSAEWRDLLHGAFEEGVNAFEIVNPSPALLAGVAAGVSAVKRSLLFIGLRIDASLDPATLGDWVDDAIDHAGVSAFNLLALSADTGLDPDMLAAMRRLKEFGRVQRTALAGDGDALGDRLDLRDFDGLITPFNLLSGWRERRMIRTALESHMGVIAADACPARVDELIKGATAQAKPGWFKAANPLAGVGSYGFLAGTPGWTTEQLCVGYALTEPAVASVQIRATDRAHLTSLAGVTERELPVAASAQIEMARFSSEQAARAAGPQARHA